MQSKNFTSAQHIPGGHTQSRNRHNEHTAGHREQGGLFTHQRSYQIHGQHNHQRIHVSVPTNGTGLSRQTSHVFRHRGIQLMLHHPKSGNNQDQNNQPSVGTNFHQRRPYLPESFSFPGVFITLVKQINRDQRKESHSRGEIIQHDHSLVSHGITQRGYKHFPGESTDIHHPVKNSKSPRPTFLVRLFGHRTGDHTLNK